MLHTVSTTIETDGSGNATVYLGSIVLGYLVSLKYSPGNIATGADLTITGEKSGVPILTKLNAGITDAFFYPRALPTNVADGSDGSVGSEMIPIVGERIKVVIAQGGDTNKGTIEATYETAPPF